MELFLFSEQTFSKLTSLVILCVLQFNAFIVVVALCVARPTLYLETITCKGQTIFKVIDTI